MVSAAVFVVSAAVVVTAVVVVEAALPPFCAQPDISSAQAANIEIAVFFFIVLLPFMNSFVVTRFHKYRRRNHIIGCAFLAIIIKFVIFIQNSEPDQDDF